MNRIEIKFTNGDYITIKLFDNTLSSNLVNNFKLFNDRYDLINRTSNTYENFYEGRIQDKHIIDDEWNNILSSLSKLKDLGVVFTRDIPNSFDFSQDTLNYLHRIFTYSDFFFVDEITNQTDEFPFTPNYVTPNITREELYYITEEINSSVHNLETYVFPTQTRNILSTTNKLSRLWFENNGQPKKDTFATTWYELTEDENKYNYDFLKHTESHIVCLTDTILGKSVLASFKDDDNPTLPDCQGRTITNGSFIIYPNRGLHDLYNSDKFTEWLSKYNMNSNELPLEVAIGYVVDSSNSLESFFFENNSELELLSVRWLSN